MIRLALGITLFLYAFPAQAACEIWTDSRKYSGEYTFSRIQMVGMGRYKQLIPLYLFFNRSSHGKLTGIYYKVSDSGGVHFPGETYNARIGCRGPDTLVLEWEIDRDYRFELTPRDEGIDVRFFTGRFEAKVTNASPARKVTQ